MEDLKVQQKEFRSSLMIDFPSVNVIKYSQNYETLMNTYSKKKKIALLSTIIDSTLAIPQAFFILIF